MSRFPRGRAATSTIDLWAAKLSCLRRPGDRSPRPREQHASRWRGTHMPRFVTGIKAVPGVRSAFVSDVPSERLTPAPVVRFRSRRHHSRAMRLTIFEAQVVIAGVITALVSLTQGLAAELDGVVPAKELLHGLVPGSRRATQPG